MSSLYVVRRQVGFVVAIAALLLALVVPALASAAEVTTRSISLSSASKGATDVSYSVAFTPQNTAGAVVIDFCSDSPSIGATCTTPAGFSAASASIAEADDEDFTIYTTGSADDANTVVIASEMNGGTPVSFTLEGITNPSAAGSIFARIVTYDTSENAGSYVSNESNATDTDRVDTGSVAIAIRDTIAVSGAVHESLTFCVSGATIAADCDGAATPVLELGEGEGALKALSASAVSTGDLFTQISTNAASGAVVNLKSDSLECGGLINSSKPGCFIGPALDFEEDFLKGSALFGVKVASDSDPTGEGVVSDGTFQVATGANYNSTAFFLNYVEGDQTGVTSVFGDPILDTGNEPASNKNMKLTFGASVSNTTPAGKYAANLSLIATGKF